ncbi:MAG: J domain-containing protein [Clostridiales bacterium]|nr:J domain-containing protein [Clostridiales bacterium]
MKQDELKQKLRQLKHLEVKIRFGGEAQPAARLVWSRFFDTRAVPASRVKYPLDKLAAMSKEAYKAVVDEYFAYVYYELYRENETELLQGIYDPEVLKKLGLPHDAGIQDIKRRFRELAKKYHPDTGGDAARFIELMETYKQLLGKTL